MPGSGPPLASYVLQFLTRLYEAAISVLDNLMQRIINSIFDEMYEEAKLVGNPQYRG